MRWRAWGAVIAVELFGGILATRARAQQPPPPPLFTFKLAPRWFIRLELTLGPGAQACPSYSERMLHDEVGRRLGSRSW
jgi:hypothetical protein